MIKRIVIAVSGRIKNGKDTIADHLIANHGFVKLSFAEALRQEVIRVWGRTIDAIHDMNVWIDRDSNTNDTCGTKGDHVMTAECVYNMLYIYKPKGIRELLQEHGTELRRNEDPMYWCKKWWEGAEKLINTSERIVVPDTRFENEAKTILDFGGNLWRVERPGIPVNDHPSEHALDHWKRWDVFFMNNEGVAELLTLVDRRVAEVLA